MYRCFQHVFIYSYLALIRTRIVDNESERNQNDSVFVKKDM